ncbi:SpoIIE family protein phosphatase [Thermobifida halotolerans]|uniref:protein-serine/threonine phosphatase n=1 Tax=Thermobifida halotolerans TaxID=483545 RepID=A0AA97M181_9ACTN|nr:SpoIIE family protein phosphatase [Thermobifida halotolerans]UOE21540.1 SpoIIE family protein phosphatase [Thermobifida halotolerans]
MEPTDQRRTASPTTRSTGGTRARAAGSPRDDREQRALLRQRLDFLNEATMAIGGSLDPEKSAFGFADALVPLLADFAAVHLHDTLLPPHPLDIGLPESANALPRTLRQTAVTHDGDARWAVLATEDGTWTPDPAHPAHRAMATGRPVVCDVDETVARALTGDRPETLLGCPLLAVPLSVRGRTLGAALLMRGPGHPHFDEVDVLTARQLAAQASLGVDNAHLYRAQTTIGDALQHSMLPTLPSRLSSVDIAYRYVSSSHTAQVGGDWFDAIPLPGSRVALVVGDVMGHGLRSAAVMGQFRTAVQTLAAMDLPPDHVLRHLDDLAHQLGEGYLATCLYAVYDPVTHRCSIASAGHVPPVLLHSDGTAELLRPPTGAPIGLGGVAFESFEFTVDDGEVLVLCTDGLVESRHRDVDSGLAALRANLAHPDLPLDDQCETLLRALHTPEQEDDVALLLARLRGVPSGDFAQWMLQPRPTTPALARRLIRTTLTEWGLPSLIDLVELLATELVTNAVRYASRPIDLRLLRTDILLCEVTDDDQHRPVLRQASTTDEGGRGLQLVSSLSRRWGASAKTTGKVVWFELDLPADGHAFPPG